MTRIVGTLGGLVLAVSAVGAQPPATKAKGGIVGVLERAAQTRAQAKASEQFDPVFRKYTKRYFGPGFDWRYFKAQGMAESELNPNAKSWVGARGIMQLMPTTFAEIYARRPGEHAIDDPEWNIAAGIMHDRYLWSLWSKDVDERERPSFMFGSYNAGEGTIGRARGVAQAAQLDHRRWSSIEQVAPNVQRWRYRETIGYVHRIDANYLRLSRQR